MPVINNAGLKTFELPGLVHQTIAGKEQGVEVWRQTLAPKAATFMHRHDCEEIIVILRGKDKRQSKA